MAEEEEGQGKWRFVASDWEKAEKKQAKRNKERAEAFFHHVHLFLREHIDELQYYGDIRMKTDEDWGGITRQEYVLMEADFLQILNEAYKGLWQCVLRSKGQELIFYKHTSSNECRNCSKQCGAPI